MSEPPIHTPTPYTPAPYPTSPYATPVPEVQSTNVLASVSLVLAFFVSVGAVITGHIALVQIKRTGERGRGLALAGVILGYLGVAFSIIGILAAIAIPAFLNQRVRAWDASVQSDLGNAAIAAASYSVQNNGSYVGSPPLTMEVLESTYGLRVTEGNTLTVVSVSANSYVIIGSNDQSADGHTYTLTTGYITGPD